MKKIVSILLCMILVFCMSGCGSSDSSTPPKNNDQPNANGSASNDASTPSDPGKQETKSTEYTIADYVVVDNDSCKMTVISCTAKKSGGIDVKVQLENKTTDKTLVFSWDDVAVNGWVIDPLFAKSVAPGKKANDTISFSKSDFEKCNLTSADKVEFKLRVYDENDWSADDIVEDVFCIYPTGLDDAAVKSPQRTSEANEVVVVDNEQCTFVIVKNYVDKIWGYTLSVYLENKSDINLMFSWDDVSVNGFMIDPFWASSVPAGNKKVSTINFSSSEFEENGIKDVEEIEFSLSIHDDDRWDAKDIVNDVFSYQPK